MGARVKDTQHRTANGRPRRAAGIQEVWCSRSVTPDEYTLHLVLDDGTRSRLAFDGAAWTGLIVQMTAMRDAPRPVELTVDEKGDEP